MVGLHDFYLKLKCHSFLFFSVYRLEVDHLTFEMDMGDLVWVRIILVIEWLLSLVGLLYKDQGHALPLFLDIKSDLKVGVVNKLVFHREQ